MKFKHVANVREAEEGIRAGVEDMLTESWPEGRNLTLEPYTVPNVPLVIHLTRCHRSIDGYLPIASV